MRTPAALLLFSLAAFAQIKRPVEEFQTSAGVVKITPIQHASLLIEAGGQTIQVDPTARGNYDGLPPAAGLILITDIHGDHMDPQMVSKLSKSGTVVMAPKAAADKLSGAIVISNGEAKNFGKWKIDAVPMYNINAQRKQYHEKGRGNGYILTYGGMRFYISGDTEGTPEMKALQNIDVAFVCMNLPYTMPPEEAAEAVRAFHPKIVYPYHYGKSDLSVFEKALAGSGIEVRIRNWYY